MIQEGYQQIAFIGGPLHINLFRQRKKGFIKAIKKAALPIPYNFIVDDNISKENAYQTALQLLALPQPPNAFLTISDLQALGFLRAVTQVGRKIPQEVGILGYANEPFTEIIEPSISTVKKKSEELGYQAAMVYFQEILNKEVNEIITKVIESELTIRKSSRRSS